MIEEEKVEKENIGIESELKYLKELRMEALKNLLEKAKPETNHEECVLEVAISQSIFYNLIKFIGEYGIWIETKNNKKHKYLNAWVQISFIGSTPILHLHPMYNKKKFKYNTFTYPCGLGTDFWLTDPEGEK